MERMTSASEDFASQMTRRVTMLETNQPHPPSITESLRRKDIRDIVRDVFEEVNELPNQTVVTLLGKLNEQAEIASRLKDVEFATQQMILALTSPSEEDRAQNPRNSVAFLSDIQDLRKSIPSTEYLDEKIGFLTDDTFRRIQTEFSVLRDELKDSFDDVHGHLDDRGPKPESERSEGLDGMISDLKIFISSTITDKIESLSTKQDYRDLGKKIIEDIEELNGDCFEIKQSQSSHERLLDRALDRLDNIEARLENSDKQRGEESSFHGDSGNLGFNAQEPTPQHSKPESRVRFSTSTPPRYYTPSSLLYPPIEPETISMSAPAPSGLAPQPLAKPGTDREPPNAPVDQTPTASPVVASKPKLKSADIPKFGGGTDEDVELWITRASAMAYENEDALVPILPTILVDNANKWFSVAILDRDNPPPRTWEEWKIKLRNNFRPANYQSRLYTRLTYRRWQKSESFSDYFQDRRLLQAQVIPDATTQQCIEDMLQGIPSDMLAMIKIAIKSEPSISFDEFKRTIVDIEPSLLSQFGHKRAGADPRQNQARDQTNNPGNQGNQRRNYPNSNWQNRNNNRRQDRNRRPDNHSTQQQQQQQHRNPNKPDVGGFTVVQPASPGNNQSRPRNNANFRPKTNTASHAKIESPPDTDDDQRVYTVMPPSVETEDDDQIVVPVSYIATKHIAHSYAARLGDYEDEPAFLEEEGDSLTTDINSSPIPTASPTTHDPRSDKANFGSSTTPSPDIEANMSFEDKTPAITRISIDGHALGTSFNACLDSGSSISLIDQSLLKKHCPSAEVDPTSTFDVKGVGSNITICGSIILKIVFEDTEGRRIPLPVKFYVNPVPGPKIILGIDFFVRYKGNIDISKNICTLYDDETLTIPITCKKPTMPTLRLAQVWTIKGFHTARVPANILGTLSSEDFYVDPEPLTSSIAVARTIDSVQGTRRHFLELTNLGPFPVTLAANKTLGTIFPLVDCTAKDNSEPSSFSTKNSTPMKEEHEIFMEAIRDLDINDQLTKAQKDQLMKVLLKNKNVFAHGKIRLGNSAGFEVVIDTGDAHPISTPPYHTSPKGREFISQTVAKLLAEDIIEPSDSPWASNVVLISQKGKIRFCIDYRKLNTVTKADQYPLPRIDDYLNQFQGKTWFSTFDANSGFHQIPVAPGDREKLAFRTHEGHFQYKRMPFGIRNGPSVFQRVMDRILGNAKWAYALVYIDDIVVYSDTFEQHLEHLDKLFSKILTSGLTLSIPKSHVCQREILALGHHVSRLGIGMNKENVRAIADFKRPSSVKEVQSFLGLAGYYRRFIQNFAQIARPLTHLLAKDVEFVWTELCEQAFKSLRDKLTQEPILAHPDYEKEFLVHTDASLKGIGAFLSQIGDDEKEHMLCAVSRQLTAPEENYAATELECLAIVWALRKFHPYINGCKSLKIYTDHSALQWLWNYNGTNMRLRRWTIELDPFRYTAKIIHRSGKANANADALSRSPVEDRHPIDPPLVNAITTFQIKSDFLESIRRGYTEDSFFAPIVHAFKSKEPRGHLSLFELNDNLLYRRSTSEAARQLCIPRYKNLRLMILNDNHDARSAGHFGEEKTLFNISKSYYWPHLSKDVKRYVASCTMCQENKSSNKQTPGLLIPNEIPPARWHTVTMDFAGPFVPTEGFDMVMIVVDKLSKRAHFEATRNVDDAPAILRLFMNRIVRYHGMPRVIISDRDTKLTSNFWQEFFRSFGTKTKFSTANHPQTDGQSERMVRTLKDMIRHYINYSQKNWLDLLPILEIAYNNALNSTTGFTPFELDLGYHPTFPQNFIQEPDTAIQAIADLINKLKKDIISAQDAIQRAQLSQAKFYNKKHRFEQFKLGDLVMLSGKHVHPPWQKKRKTKKLIQKWYGPFKVLETKNDNAYVLELPATMKIHSTINIEYLKRYTESPEDFSKRRVKPSPPIVVENEEHYEIENILDHETKNNQIKFLVKWKGYADHENMWLPRKELQDSAAEILEEYERENNLSTAKVPPIRKRKSNTIARTTRSTRSHSTA
jgi:hypothetical protein